MYLHFDTAQLFQVALTTEKDKKYLLDVYFTKNVAERYFRNIHSVFHYLKQHIHATYFNRMTKN